MTKTLTEQWREGTLRGYFYWKLPNGNICTAYTDTMRDIKNVMDSDEVEVLQETPSYVENKRLQEQLKEANEVIKKFEKTEIGHKQKDGTYILTVCGVIIDPEKRPTSALVQEETYFYDPRPLTKYLKKWGVK